MERLLNTVEPRIIRLLMISAVLLSAAALFSYVLLPDLKAYRQALKERSTLQKVAAGGDALERQLTELGQAVDQLGRQLHGDMADLPDKQLEAFVIGRLQNISWRNGMELVSVKPRKGQVVQIFREMLFDVQVSGSYFNLFNWLQGLAEEQGFVVVEHYRIEPQDATQEDPRLSINLTIVSYRKA